MTKTVFDFIRLIYQAQSSNTTISVTMSASLFARNFARRTFESSLRAKVAPQLGGVRFASFFTPGKIAIA
jgi:hypothetical protein